MAYDDGDPDAGDLPFVSWHAIPAWYWTEPPGFYIRDAEVPARNWIEAEDGKRIGLGKSRFRTRHGSAIALHFHVGPLRIWGAQLGDGRLVHCRRSLGKAWRRRSDNGRGWFPGTIEIQEDAVLFRDGGQPRYEPQHPPEHIHELETAISNTPEFMRLLQDDSFANELYFTLCNQEFCKISRPDKREGLSFGSIAGMIADLRGVGEWYLDFKSLGLEPPPPRYNRREIVHQFRAVGWQLVSEVDRFEEHQLGWDLLRAYEARPGASCPEWAVKFDVPVVRSGLPSTRRWYDTSDEKLERLPQLNTRHRLLAMAVLDQISQEEFLRLEEAKQQEFAEYESRPHGVQPDWAAGFMEELAAIETEALSCTFRSYGELPAEQQEVVFAPRLRWRLVALARSGRVTQPEYERLLRMLDQDRYN